MLINDEGEQFIINNGSFKIIDDTFPVETDITERSYTEGSIAPGETRGTTKQLVYQLNLDKQRESIFRSTANELIRRAREAVTIRDRINEIETDVRLGEFGISYDEGGQFRGSIKSITFNQLIPFWKDIEFIELSETSTLSNQLIVDNDGYFETWPIFTLRADQNIQKFLIKVEETNLGIGLNDFSFGTVYNEIYVIDCENGEALLNGILRNNRIIGTTGFFPLRVGINTINVTTVNNIDLDFSVKYKRRYFI
jgi:hypothetical protein